MSDTARVRPIDLGCPTCSQEGGQECLRVGTKQKTGYLHATRVDAARAITRLADAAEAPRGKVVEA